MRWAFLMTKELSVFFITLDNENHTYKFYNNDNKYITVDDAL